MGDNLSMSGTYIGASIPVDAVRKLNNGTVVYMAKQGPYVKMVAAGNKDGRYYKGTVDQFTQDKWDQATRVPEGSYIMISNKRVGNKKGNYDYLFYIIDMIVSIVAISIALITTTNDDYTIRITHIVLAILFRYVYLGYFLITKGRTLFNFII
jgi:hypothetical protein